MTEDCELSGHRLEKNDSIFIMVGAIHRDEKYFTDPEKFNPERFLNENVKEKSSFCYIPFSAGKRNCIGQKFALMELKVVLTSLLRNFKISCEKNINDIFQVSEITLRSANDVCVNFEPRFL